MRIFSLGLFIATLLISLGGCRSDQSSGACPPDKERFALAGFSRPLETSTLPDGTVRRSGTLKLRDQIFNRTSEIEWVGDEYTDGSPVNWSWTLRDKATGVQRTYKLQTAEQLFTESDGKESHTIRLVKKRKSRLASVELDGQLFAEACQAVRTRAELPFARETPATISAAYQMLRGMGHAPPPRNNSCVCKEFTRGCFCCSDAMMMCNCCSPNTCSFSSTYVMNEAPMSTDLPDDAMRAGARCAL